jgi:hypothetical protein
MKPPLSSRSSRTVSLSLALAGVVLAILAGAFTARAGAQAAEPLPAGYWDSEHTGPILQQTLTLRLAPDLSGLTPGERAALEALLEVGGIFQDLYEQQRHPQARVARAALEALDRARGGTPETRALVDLYRLNQGPIATTLDNTREPFLPVAASPPGGSLYPDGVTKTELEAFLAAHPQDRAGLLAERTVVRRADAEGLRPGREALERHPGLALLNPGLHERLSRSEKTGGFVSLPYAVAYAEPLVRAHDLLRLAADAVEPDDAELAGYLRNRGRDLVTNDYESGDAAWVTGRFGRLNTQLGAYEVYDDALFGVKAFFGASLLLRDEAASARLRQAIAGLQGLEDRLPYDAKKRVRQDIPVGVYDVIADFGQARGTNTATILPNDPLYARRYGRTILLRANIMRHPELFANAERAWRAVMADPFDDDLALDGDFQRTLWHEVGHYLGVDRTADGRGLDAALEAQSSRLEEMKADLVSLFSGPALRSRGYYDDAGLRALYASGIRRTFQTARPRPDQPYQTMQLAQLNFFLDRGLVRFDAARGELAIAYGRYHDVVAELLAEVLALQRSGDPAGAAAFFERWTGWEEALHGVLARKISAERRDRFRLVRYAALGE